MEQALLVGYTPHVTIYEYKKNSKCKFWMNYKLPNGKRIRRPCANQKSIATHKALIKQGQLSNSKFDEYDRKRLVGYLKSDQKFTFEEAVSLYFEFTESNKRKKTIINDKSLLKIAFNYFCDQNLSFLEEVKPLHCSRFISELRSRGFSDSSLKNSKMAVSKLFNCLRKMKEISLDNPMNEISLPKNMRLQRDRLPSIEEIGAIQSVLEVPNGHSSNASPIGAIINFAIYTGARISEVLHCERGDFDLDNGYWNIQCKPHCPSSEGMGWEPKWGKERRIKLLPQALSLLLNQEYRKTVGFIADKNNELKAIPAEFVFPKKQIRISEKCSMLVKKGYSKCSKCREHPKIDDCEYRSIIYSRCDSIKKAWTSVRKKAGVTDMVFHDIRRFFNRTILQEELGLTPEYAGRYIGNSKIVNMEHYSPISNDYLDKIIEGSNCFESIGIGQKEVSCQYLVS
jgi:integrase